MTEIEELANLCLQKLGFFLVYTPNEMPIGSVQSRPLDGGALYDKYPGFIQAQYRIIGDAQESDEAEVYKLLGEELPGVRLASQHVYRAVAE